MSMTDDDISQGLFSLFGELKLTLGELSQSVKQQRRLQAEARRAEQPSFNRIHASGIVAANGFLILAFDQPGPTQGYTWHVRTLVVGGLTPVTACPGRADVFSLGSDPLNNASDMTTVGLSGWRDTTATLPNIATYAEGELFMRFPEQLVVMVSGGTAGQQIVASGTVQNVQDAANRQETML